jgi:hypothetical protein
MEQLDSKDDIVFDWSNERSPTQLESASGLIATP